MEMILIGVIVVMALVLVLGHVVDFIFLKQMKDVRPESVRSGGTIRTTLTISGNKRLRSAIPHYARTQDTVRVYLLEDRK